MLGNRYTEVLMSTLGRIRSFTGATVIVLVVVFAAATPAICRAADTSEASVMLILGNLAADLLLALSDPRIRYE